MGVAVTQHGETQSSMTSRLGAPFGGGRMESPPPPQTWKECEREFLAYNDSKISDFLALPILVMIRNGQMKEPYKGRFSAFLNTLSSYFQKILMLRVVTSSDSAFEKMAKKHLDEEIGHDSLLKEERFDDEICKGLCTWFVHQMICRSDVEKHIIMHSVLEVSAEKMFNLYIKYVRPSEDNKYFYLHADADEQHSQMGLDLVINRYPYQKALILNTLDEGWNMLNQLYNRAHTLVMGEA